MFCEKTKKFLAAILVIAMFFAFSGCTKQAVDEEITNDPSATNEEQAQSGQEVPDEVVVLQGSDSVTLDPHFSGGLSEATLFEHIMGTLVTHDRDMKIVPRLATEWETLNNNYTWRFKLRQDVTFHDGSKFTANDVKFTFDRVMDPNLKAKGNTPWLLNNMNVDKVEVVDEYTIDITTKEPNPILPVFMAEFYILSEHYYKDLPLEEAAVNPVGTGPYKFVEWKKGDRIIIERYDGFYGEKPSIQRIVWRSVPEAATRVAELKTGGAHLIYPLPPDMANDIGENASLKSIKGGIRRFVGISFYNHPALKDTKVRQAFNYAVDVDTILQSLIGGPDAKRTAVTVNPPWNNEKLQPYPYDPQKAKTLLAEAGWKDTDNDGVLDKNGEKLSLTFMSSNGKSIKDLEISQAIAGYLQEIGIEVVVKPMEWSTYTGLLHDKKVSDLYYLGSGSTFEGQGDLADLQKNSSSNYGQWINEEFEDRWVQLVKEFDNTKRKQLMDEMQEIVYNDPPYIFLYFQVDFYGVANNLDWEPYRDGRIRLYDAKFN